MAVEVRVAVASKSGVTPGRRKGFWRRNWKYVLAATGMVVLTVLIVGVALLYTTPSWYKPVSVEEEGVADRALAAQLKLANLKSSDSRAAKLEDRTWVITDAEINALLASRFGGAGEAPAPEGRNRLSDPMVRFERGRVILAARATQVPGRNPAGGVISLAYGVRTLSAEPGGAGHRVQIVLEGVWANSLPVPKSWVEKKFDALRPAIVQAVRTAVQRAFKRDEADRLTPMVVDVVERIFRNEPFAAEAVDAQGRKVQLKELTIGDGSLTVTLGPPGGA